MPGWLHRWFERHQHRCGAGPARRRCWLHRWFERHQHPASRVLHAIGIPMLVAIPVVIAVQFAHGRWDLWWTPLVLLGGSYLLQWLGHRIEGNDMGELILIKKWLGRPYVAVAPRYRKSQD